MNKQKFKSFINIFCVFILVLFVFSPCVNATEGDTWWDQGNNFISEGKKKAPIKTNDIKGTLMPIGRTLVTIATITLTVVTVVMGIKYMMCDNANQKATLKKQLIGLVVSTVIIYGAQFLWATLYNFMSSVTGG